MGLKSFRRGGMFSNVIEKGTGPESKRRKDAC